MKGPWHGPAVLLAAGAAFLLLIASQNVRSAKRAAAEGQRAHRASWVEFVPVFLIASVIQLALNLASPKLGDVCVGSLATVVLLVAAVRR